MYSYWILLQQNILLQDEPLHDESFLYGSLIIASHIIESGFIASHIIESGFIANRTTVSLYYYYCYWTRVCKPFIELDNKAISSANATTPVLKPTQFTHANLQFISHKSSFTYTWKKT